MASDQIQPERSSNLVRRLPSTIRQTWVQLDFHFWHRCTIESVTDSDITVALDNLDEFTVPHYRVEEFELERGDFVFVQRSDFLGGDPAFVIAAEREVVTVEYFVPKGKGDQYKQFTREMRVYFDLSPRLWEKKTRVFAYKPVDFHPPLFLMFPAVVNEVHHGLCVDVEFDDGGRSLVPITLVESFDVSPGDTVYTCVIYESHGTERWGPCRVLNCDGDLLLVHDAVNVPFEIHKSLIAILPRGYEMPDGKLQKVGAARRAGASPSVLEMSKVGDVHIVRTDRWQDAATAPISKRDVDALIAADPELSWSTDDRIVADRHAGQVAPGHAIHWKGQPGFWWNQSMISCSRPDSEQIAKMIDIAIAIDANVIGHAGDEFH